MDWWKLFALLVAVVSQVSTAEGAKKKIRIHLPQKVKHIHHHKKIYITNHPASSQYAPAYMPTADGAMAVPTSVALPPVSNILPLKPVDLYDDRQPQLLPGVAPQASKLLPLYRARGYYGPQPNQEAEEHEYDLIQPADNTPRYVPSAFSAPSAPAAPANFSPKRVKVVKVKDTPRKKKIVRKRKPKRVVNDTPPAIEEETPVSSFHEQFYSDVDNTGTIRKIRKPKRVEKIIDGDTEHIHTYSEEHIHKVVFDDGSKLGVDPSGSMSAISGAHPLLPLKNLAMEQDSYAGLPYGTLGTPSHLEYSAYNPREVTHDHIFHDHGEIPAHVDLTKDSLAYPPKASYTASGIKLNVGDYKRPPTKPKYHQRTPKPTRPTPTLDFSYYENMYTATGRPKQQRQPVKYNNEQSVEANIDDFRPIPAFRFNDKTKVKNNAYYGHVIGKPNTAYQLGLPSQPVPFSTQSNNAYDFTANSYTGVKTPVVTGFSNFKDPFSSYGGVYSHNFNHDNSFASSSNTDNSGGWSQTDNRGKKKKSISTQNISFGGHDLKTIVDHLAEASNLQSVLKENPAQISHYEGFDSSKPIETATPTTHFTITENSPAHDYYTNMAIKAFQDEPMNMPEASNTLFHFAEAPPPTTPTTHSLPTPAENARPFFRSHSTDSSTVEPSVPHSENRKVVKRRRQKNKASRLSTTAETLQKHMELGSSSQDMPMSWAVRPAPAPAPTPTMTQSYKRGRASRPQPHIEHTNESPSTRGVFKYGDKI